MANHPSLKWTIEATTGHCFHQQRPWKCTNLTWWYFVSKETVTNPWSGINGSSLFDQSVGDSHVTFLSHKMQRRQPALHKRKAYFFMLKSYLNELSRFGIFVCGFDHFPFLAHLVPQVNVGLFGDEQGHHVRPPLLRGQVQGRDALQGLYIGCCPVLQETTGHLNLILLGRDVQGSVAVLWGETKRKYTRYHKSGRRFSRQCLRLNLDSHLNAVMMIGVLWSTEVVI